MPRIEKHLRIGHVHFEVQGERMESVLNAENDVIGVGLVREVHLIRSVAESEMNVLRPVLIQQFDHG